MNTAVARQPAKSTAVAFSTDEQLREFLTARQGEFAMIAKASGVEVASLVGELVGVARRKPDILKCTPDSVINFMYDSAKLGLIIGHGCFPVPVRDNRAGVTNCECWIGYKGMKELVIYGRGARDIFAQIVYDGDEFEEILGIYPDIKHKPGPHFGDMEHAIGVYAVAVISQTIRRHRYLPKSEIEKYRKMNRSDTTASSSPWVAHPASMWKAKAMLRLTSDMPRNARLAHAYAVIERNEGGIAPASTPSALPASVSPATAAAGAVAPKFEEEQETASVRLPKWRGHPLAEKLLSEVSRDDLEALYSQLRDASEKGDKRYDELNGQIAAELDERRQAA